MFVGHAAIAALAGAARPRVPLLPVVIAAYAADAVEILLHAAGFAHPRAMLWSHSVTALVVGGALTAAVAGAVYRRWETAVTVAAVYASHGLADLLTGERKPAWDGGPTYGFGLYQAPVADFALEVALLLLGAALLHLRRGDRGRRLALVVTLLTLLQLGFNASDGSRLHGLKRNLMRATGGTLGRDALSRLPTPDRGGPHGSCTSPRRLLPRVCDA